MREIIAGNGEIVLGKRGEKNAVCVLFDVTDWQRDYGDGVYNLIYQRNGDTYPYPCVIERDSGYIRWVITDTETAKAGKGKAELQLVQDGVIVKSDTFVTRVIQSLAPPSETPPEPGQGWIEKILELINGGGGGCDCKKELSSIEVTETASDVTFITTFADGSIKERVITKDANGNPNGMTDDGKPVAVSWTEVDA